MRKINYSVFGEFGLSMREYLSAHLRVRDTGDAHMDAMISAANRMRIAESAMQGMLAGHAWASHADLDSKSKIQSCAATAVAMADALINELNKGPPR